MLTPVGPFKVYPDLLWALRALYIPLVADEVVDVGTEEWFGIPKHSSPPVTIEDLPTRWAPVKQR